MEYTLKLSEADLAATLNALAVRPYRDVFAVIREIETQANAQLQAAQPKPEGAAK